MKAYDAWNGEWVLGRGRPRMGWIVRIKKEPRHDTTWDDDCIKGMNRDGWRRMVKTIAMVKFGLVCAVYMMTW